MNIKCKYNIPIEFAKSIIIGKNKIIKLYGGIKMKVEEIAIRQEARQMLNEAGINKNTLKDMVKDILDEKIERAIQQALHERDIDGAVSRKIERCIETQANNIVREEIRRKISSIFDRMTVDVTITDTEGRHVTSVK